MLEQIRSVRRDALPEQQSSRNETVKRRLKLRASRVNYRSQQGMRELTANSRTDLCHFPR
jgi:hypothetical protein